MEKILHFFYKLKYRVFTILMNPCFYSIGKKSIIVPPFRFNNLSQVKVGDNVTIQSSCWIQVIPNKLQQSPVIIIKDNVGIGMNATISGIKKIVIAEHTIFGRNVYISDHGHEYHDIKKPIAEQGIRKKSEVIIGRGVWLGQNAVILPGANIGDNSVIGANSVVSTRIPKYSVAVGAPASVIRRYNSQISIWEHISNHVCPNNELKKPN